MLPAGTRLGPYEIIAPAGSGGMGEVYRARDARLGRDVAIKLLLAGASVDRERLARFEQEARAAAALNHPNIVAVYDIGERDGAPYIVSELLEGETLRARLAGGALPVRKAIEYGVQIARGLAAAHEKGIVHRDLKPENVFITRDGGVKILDFGLAKLTQPESSLAGLSMLPTTPPDTLPGLVLGTIGYMSPEQVRGLAADHRSDVFAFGAILYEMLAGRRAFEGATPMDTMLAIAKGDAPELPVVERRIPPALARIVARCLERDPSARFESMRDLAFSLEALASQADTASSGVMVDPAIAAAAASTARPAQSWIAWGVAAVAVVAALAIGFVHFREPLAQPHPVRFAFTPPGPQAAFFTLAPDGRALAFAANSGNVNQLWIRTMDALEARPVPGTGDATYPFWSPDGQYLAFFAEGKLKKVAIAGGPPQTLCDVASARGGTWSKDGVILFSAGPTSAILRVPAEGGTPVPVTKLAGNDPGYGHRFPSFLPDGQHFLYTVNSQRPEVAGLYVATLSDGSSTRLLPDATNGIYASSGASGYLFFRREGTLMARPFDAAQRTFTGEMFPVAEKVSDAGNLGFGAFSAAADTLIYRAGEAALNRQLIWVDRTGKRVATIGSPGAFANGIALSPDEKKVATGVLAGTLGDIWLEDLDRSVLTRFSFRQGVGMSPQWSPDGSRLAYTIGSPSVSAFDIYMKSAASNGQEQLLLHGGINARPTDWSPDGKFLIYEEQGRNTDMDLWLLPLEGDRKPVPYLTSSFREAAGRFAPTREGAPRWVAYESNESGHTEVYVQTVPTTGAKYQISSGGGELPRWRADGKELFYITPDTRVMAVPITLGATIELGTPRMLFAGASYTDYTPSRDGQRFLVNAPAEGQTAIAPVTVVLDWAAALKR